MNVAFLSKLKKSWESEKSIFIILLVTFVLALFARTYRLSDLLGFYYDQGRDALVIWNLWYKGKLFLVGPVTGLEGIFLGPFYYYLIAPFYLIGGGDPVYPAVFLALLSVSAIGVLYQIATIYYSKTAGVIVILISSFSYYLILAGRWLSNPTPIMLTSALLLLFMHKLASSKDQKYWIAISVVVGLSMQFESASAIFFFPVLVAFYLWLIIRSRNAYTISFRDRYAWIAVGVFILTLLPQIVFNFRHDNLLFDNFGKIFFEGKKGGGFGTDFNTILPIRLSYFWSVFSSKLMPGKEHLLINYVWAAVIGLLVAFKENKTNILLLVLFIAVPMVGYIFFQGNYGNIYDYYMTGYYLPLMLLFSVGLAQFWQSKFGKFLVISFIIAFGIINIPLTKNYLVAGVDGPTHITLGNQKQAVDWIFTDAMSQGIASYNVDVYVPPVIPHTYTYLLEWQGKSICGPDLCGLTNENKEIVYVLYEVDPPHPERLTEWMQRYTHSSELLEEINYGGVHVQRRMRLEI